MSLSLALLLTGIGALLYLFIAGVVNKILDEQVVMEHEMLSAFWPLMLVAVVGMFVLSALAFLIKQPWVAANHLTGRAIIRWRLRGTIKIKPPKFPRAKVVKNG